MTMKEQDREVLARFDAIWGRVQPERAPEPAAQPETPSETEGLRLVIEQTTAAAQVLSALAQKVPCCASRLRALSCERKVMARQLQGAYYLLTGERCTPGASCAAHREHAKCLRCLWQTSRNQAAHARRYAEATDEPLLQALYTELAELLDAQCEALLEIICTVLG
jgi:hypothetical protein